MGIIKHLFAPKTPPWKREKEVARLYELYKQPFITFLMKYYQLDEQTATDIYQESFAALCQNVTSGRYDDDKGFSLKTYLFEIGKHHACNWLRANRKHEPEQISTIFGEWLEGSDSNSEWTRASEIAAQLVNESEEGCRRILTLYYWNGLRMADIAREMSYKTEQVAKNKKSSCLRRLTYELRRRMEAADIYWKKKS